MKQSLYSGHFGRIKPLLPVLVLSALLSPNAAAHLMVAQRGTLNFVGDSVFMVLSLPVSAFEDVDDDGDGKLSPVEFTKHRPVIADTVNEEVRLLGKDGLHPLHSMMLSPVAPHDAPKAPVDQLVVMGRFALAGTHSDLKFRDLKFHVGLFGKQPEEQTFTINVTRPVTPRKHKIVLTPEQPEGDLYPED